MMHKQVISVYFTLRVLLGLALTLSVSLAYADSAYWQHQVKQGENLILIAKQHFVNPNDWQAVQVINHIENPYRIPVGFTLRVPVAYVKLHPATAKLILVQGQVQVGDTATSLTTAENNATLSFGSVVRTGANSLAVIQFGDGTLLNLQSKSTLVLDNMRAYSGDNIVNTEVRLQAGQASVKANPKHQLGNQTRIVTPNAVAAVRGTEFRVAAGTDVGNEAYTTQETLEGQVALSNQVASVEVKKGQGTASKGSQAPLAPTPLLPAINISNLNKTLSQFPSEFQWPLTKGASAWHVKLINQQTQQLLYEDITSSSQYQMADLPNGTYQLHISALNQHHIEGFEAVHAFKVQARPFSPLLTQPQVGTWLRETNVSFEWQASEGATEYVIEVAKDAQFKNTIKHVSVTEPKANLNLPVSSQAYFWRVAGMMKQENGPYTQAQSFFVKGRPTAPDLKQFKFSVEDNRVIIVPLSHQVSNTLNVRLMHPRFPMTIQSETQASPEKLKTQSPIVLELREYGSQKLELKWIDEMGGESLASVYPFDAYSPFQPK